MSKINEKIEIEIVDFQNKNYNRPKKILLNNKDYKELCKYVSELMYIDVVHNLNKYMGIDIEGSNIIKKNKVLVY